MAKLTKLSNHLKAYLGLSANEMAGNCHMTKATLLNIICIFTTVCNMRNDAVNRVTYHIYRVTGI